MKVVALKRDIAKPPNTLVVDVREAASGKARRKSSIYRLIWPCQKVHKANKEETNGQ